jgi:UDP-N-acetylmuramate--alanine ligase
MIVYSTAYNLTNNVEVAAALRGRSRSLTYAEMLAEIFNSYYGVAVCGSHGKTTTTAWLGFLLREAGKEPNVMVGSRVPQFEGASLVGASDMLIIEADEYQNKLRYFLPRVVLMNNIDYDHPDFYPTEEEYIKAFADFAKKLSAKGLLVANYDDEKIRKYVITECKAKVVTYGLKEGADLVGYDLRVSDGRQYFKVRLKADESDLVADAVRNKILQKETNELGDFSISLAGHHNVANALAVIAASLELGVTLLDIRRFLGEFTGTARRLELLGEFRGAKIYDDYAHHPTEIRATLGGVRQLYPKSKVKVVFHPHTYSRTMALLDQFAESFALADELIVLDIYGSAREQQGGVHSQDLVVKIEALRPKGFAPEKVSYIPQSKDCERYLRETIRKGDVVILVGAGDVFRIGESLINN